MRISLTRPPRDDDELWSLVNTIWGVNFPRTAVCHDHVAPFQVFADAFFARAPQMLLHGCVPGDSLVTTDNGPVPISEVQPGTVVSGWKDGDMTKGVVKSTWISSPSAEVLELRTRVGALRATGNHRVLVCRKYRGKSDGTRRRPPNEWREEFVRLDEIRVGDYLVQEFGSSGGTFHDPELAEWHGLLVGDGFIRKIDGKYGQVAFAHHKNATYAEHYYDFLGRRYGKRPTYQEGSYNASLTSQQAWRDSSFLDGKTSHTKEIPSYLWDADRETVIAFLRGYCDSDGTVRTKDGSIEWGSCNKKLLEQVRTLCLVNGLRVGRVCYRRNYGECVVNGRTVVRGDMYDLRCYDGIEIGTNDVKYDFGERKKQSRSIRENWRAPQDRSRRRYVAVLGIKSLGFHEVWDMEVEGTHTFVCDSFVVHNSRGLSGKSFMMSNLGITEAAILGCDVNILGGSYAQSKNVLEHMSNSWSYKNAPRYMLTDDTNTQQVLTNQARIRPLTASQRTVRGPHPARLLLDEIDEMNQSILNAAYGQPMPQKNWLGATIPASTMMVSTWQRSSGPMVNEMKRMREEGLPVVTYCYKENLLENGGWLDPAFVEQKRREVPKAMWCIPDGEVIDTATGGTKVEDLQVGDLVWTREGWKPVTKVGVTGVQPVYRVTTSSGRQYRASGKHTVATPAGWVKTEDLSVGDQVAVSASSAVNTFEHVVSVTLEDQERTWDISVAECHEFTIDGIVLHNSIEYELGEPSIGDRAIDSDAVDRMFDTQAPTPIKYTNTHREYSILKPEIDRDYVVSADWAKSQDWTVICVFDVTEDPIRLAYFVKIQRQPYPKMIGIFNALIDRYHATAIHDATGLGSVVSDLIVTTRDVNNFIMAGKQRDDMLSDFVAAVENDQIRCADISELHSIVKFAGVDDLYSRGKEFHLPDEICAMALAWRLVRRVPSGTAPWADSTPIEEALDEMNFAFENNRTHGEVTMREDSTTTLALS